MDGDKDLLDRLDAKLQLIRDRTQGVAEGYANGFYLWGEGGTSKSFTVEETLKRLGKAFKLSNSRLTGRGLVTAAASSPPAVGQGGKAMRPSGVPPGIGTGHPSRLLGAGLPTRMSPSRGAPRPAGLRCRPNAARRNLARGRSR
jgi:hypothetical protein